MARVSRSVAASGQARSGRLSKRRRPGEAVDRFEGEAVAFHRNLRQAYLEIAGAEPQRCAVLDATLPPEALADAAWRILRERLPIDLEF